MSIIPTKQLTDAYNYCNKDNNSHSYQFAHFQLDKSVYKDGNKTTWDFYHYTTWILTIRKINDNYYIENGRGYSDTDRDNINGLFKLMGLDIKCKRHKNKLYYDNNDENVMTID